MNTRTVTNTTNNSGKASFKPTTNIQKFMKAPNLAHTFRTVISMIAVALFTVAFGLTANAQNTIYVDVTNGNVSGPGTSAAPFNTIDGGLNALQNGGTLIIRGGNYNGANGAGAALAISRTSNASNNLTNFTLRLEDNLPGGATNTNVALTAGTFTTTGVDVSILSDGARLVQTTATINVDSATVTLDAATSWVNNNATVAFNMNDRGRFAGFAPTLTGDAVLIYTGTGDVTAGKEAEYGDYGATNVTVNRTSGTITFPAAITTTGNFVKSNGAVVFSAGGLRATAFTNTVDDFTITSGSLVVGDSAGVLTQTAGNISVGGNVYAKEVISTKGNFTTTGSGDLVLGSKGAGAGFAKSDSGNVSVAGDLTITGKFEGVIAGFIGTGLTVGGDVNISGNYTGNATFAKIANVTGNFTVDGAFSHGRGQVTVDDTLYFNGTNVLTNTAVTAKYLISDAAMTTDSTVVVSEKTVLNNNSKLTIGAATSFTTKDLEYLNAAVTADNAVDVAATGSFTVTGNYEVSNDGSGNGELTLRVLANAGTATLNSLSFDSLDAPVGPRTYTFDVANSGTFNFGAVTSDTVTKTTGNFHAYNFDLSNTGTGTVTSTGLVNFKDVTNAGGTVSFATANAYDKIDQQAGSGLMTIAGGEVKNIFFVNGNSGNVTLTGNLEVSGPSVSIADTLNLGTYNLLLTSQNTTATSTTSNAAPGNLDLFSSTFTGSGYLVATDSARVFFNGGANINNLRVEDGSSVFVVDNSVTFNNLDVKGDTLKTYSSVTVEGNFTQSGGEVIASYYAPALTHGANWTFEGDFTRTSGLFTFAGIPADAYVFRFNNASAAQTVNFGSNFKVDLLDLVYDNENGITHVGSIRSTTNTTITPRTDVTMGEYFILLIGNNDTLDVSGSYTASDAGGIYIGGNGLVTDGIPLAAYNLVGSGIIGNLYVSVGSAGNVTYGGGTISNLDFTDKFVLHSGNFDIDGSTKSVDLSPIGDNAHFIFHADSSTFTSQDGVTTDGTFNERDNSYDLTYNGVNTAGSNTGLEFHEGYVANLTLDFADDSLTFSAGDTVISGNLVVGNQSIAKMNSRSNFIVGGNVTVEDSSRIDGPTKFTVNGTTVTLNNEGAISFPNGGSTHAQGATVTLNDTTSYSVASGSVGSSLYATTLTLNDTSDVSVGVLGISGDVTQSSKSQLHAANTSEIGGNYTMSGASVALFDGSVVRVRVVGNIDLSGTSSFTVTKAGALLNAATITVAGASEINKTLAGKTTTGAFSHSSSATSDLGADTLVAASLTISDGTVTKTSGSVTLTGDLTVSGDAAFTPGSGTYSVGGDGNFTTTTNLTLGTGAYTFTGDVTVADTVSKGAGGNLNLKGDLTVSKNLSVVGTIDFNGTAEQTATVTGAITGGGSIAVTSDIVNINGGSGAAAALKDSISADITVADSSVLNVTNIKSINGDVNVGKVAEANLALKSGRVSGTVDLDKKAELNVNAALTIETLDVDSSFVNIGANNLTLENSPMLTSLGRSIFTGTGFYVLANTNGSFDADSATIPNVRVDSAAQLTSDLIVSNNLIMNKALTGGQELTLGGNATFTNGTLTNNVYAEASAGVYTISNLKLTVPTFTLNGSVDFGAGAGDTLNVTGDYTHVSGNLDMNNNILQVGEDFRFTAGTVTIGTGYVELYGAPNDTIALASALTLNNVRLNTTSSYHMGKASKALTVTGTYTQVDGTLNNMSITGTDTTNALVFAAGATNHKKSTDSEFTMQPAASYPHYLVYEAGAVQTSGHEVPTIASVLSQLHILSDVNIDTSVTVNDTLLVKADLNNTDNNDIITMADGSYVKVDAAHGAWSVGTPLATSGEYSVHFYQTTSDAASHDSLIVSEKTHVIVDNKAASGITMTTESDTYKSLTLGRADAINVSNENLTVLSDLAVDSSASVTNFDTLFVLASLHVGETGDITGSSTDQLAITGDFTVDRSSLSFAGDYHFLGTTLQNITVDESFTVGSSSDVTLNNIAGTMLTGGDFNLANGTFYFAEGVFRTDGSSALKLNHTGTVGQGFVRTGYDNPGHVFGHVKKALLASGVASDRVTFPVGADMVDDTVSTYSPVSITFDDPQQLPAGIVLNVGHYEINTGNATGVLGINGFPIKNGIADGVDLARYPDKFYWTISANAPLSQLGVLYDLEMMRMNYNEYTNDGKEMDVEDIRIIRRANDDIDNPWRLHGEADMYNLSYQVGNENNYPEVYPVVIAQDIANYGFLDGEGTMFTYALKSNIAFTSVDTVKLNADQSKKVNLLSAFSGGTGAYTYTVVNSDSDIATGAIANDTLTVTGKAPGTTNMTITIVDRLNDTTVGTIVAHVSTAFVAGSVEDYTANVGDSTTFDFAALELFKAGTGAYTYAISSSADSVATATVTAAGVAKVKAVGVGVATITVTGTDAVGASKDVEFDVTVNAAFAKAGSVALKTLKAAYGDSVAAQKDSVDVSTLFTGGTDPITYSVATTNDAAVIATFTDSLLHLTAGVPSLTGDSVTVTVTATDSLGNALTQSFYVQVTPSLGDVNGDGKSSSIDALYVLEYVVGTRTLTAAQQALIDANADGKVNSYDAFLILSYSVGNIGKLPYTGKAVDVNGTLAWGDADQNNEEGLITLPLVLETRTGNGTFSIDFSGNFDAELFTVESVEFAELPGSWMAAHNVTEEGSINIAMMGTEAISDREIAILTLRKIEDVDVVTMSGTGFVNGITYEMAELEIVEIPEEFALEQNFPNPFNPSTTIKYSLPEVSDVKIEVFNVMGQRVMTLVNARGVKAGNYALNADFSSLASGMYIYKIEARSETEAFVQTKTMTLIK